MTPSGGMTTPVVNADPLTLRPWRIDGPDTDFVLRAASDPDIARYSSVGSARDRAAAHDWLRRRHSDDRCDWVLQLGADSIGRVSVASIDPEGRSAELGYWVLPEQRGRGYARLGTRAAIRFASDQLGIRRFRIEHEQENRASCSVALSLGFGVCAPSPTPVVVAGTSRQLWVHRATQGVG